MSTDELENAKKQINLRVLSKYDHHITSIIETTSHVVLYDFNMSSKDWKKRGIEGSLFLLERAENPKYSFVILNRTGLENLRVDIVKELQIQESGDYLMYKLADEQVHGLWVYGNEQRQSLLYHLQKCVDVVTSPPIVASPIVSANLPSLSLDEIWSALEDMAPHSQPLLSETEFLARFKILSQSPFFSRAMFIGYLQDRLSQ